MKLGSAHQNGPHAARSIDPASLVAPAYRLVGRRATSVEVLPGGRVREEWQAEGPAGFPVCLTIYRLSLHTEAAGGSLLPTPELLLNARHPHILPALSAWSADDATLLVSVRAGSTLWDRYLRAGTRDVAGGQVALLLETLTEAAKALDDLAARPGFLGHGNLTPHSLHIEGESLVLARPQPLGWETPVQLDPHGLVYAAPGRALDDADGRAAARARDDLFSLAAIYVHLRTGRPAFDPIEPASQGGSDLHPSLERRVPHLPRALGAERRVLARALAAEPSARFSCCRELVEALAKSRQARRGATRPGERGVHVGPAFHVGRLPLTSMVDASGTTGDTPGRVEHEAGLAAPWLDPTALGTGVRRLRTPASANGGGRGFGPSPRPGRRVGGMAPRAPLARGVTPVDPPSGEVALVAPTPAGASDSGLASAVVATAASGVSRPEAATSHRASEHRAAAARREGELHLAARRYREALAAYTRALAMLPADPAALHGRALAHFGLRALAPALADLDATLEACPHDASARNNRGLVRLAQGDPNGAFEDFRRAALDDPTLPVVHYNMGRARGLLALPAEALVHYDQAVALDPGFVKAYRARAAARARMGDADGALADFDRAIHLNPADGLAHHQRGLVRFACGDLGGTADDFESAVRLLPDQAAVWYDLGRVRLALGQFDRAIAAFDECLERDPNSTRAQRGRLEAETRCERERETLAQLDAAGPLARPAYATLGSAATVGGRGR